MSDPAVNDVADTPVPSREFRLYASAVSVSVVGDRVALIALIFLIIRLGHGFAPALGLFYVVRVLPSLILGLPVGALIDRVDRGRVLVLCDVGRFVLLILVPALTALSLWLIYPIVLVLYGLTLFFDTAANAALPDIVPEGSLTHANSVLRGINTAADIAYAAGGIMVAALRPAIPFYIDAATFLFSAMLVIQMRVPRVAAASSADGIARRIRDGISYLLSNPFLRWSTVTMTLAPLAGGAVFVVAPIYATRTLTQGPLPGPLVSGAFRFSVLEVSLGLGALAGSWATSRLVRRLPRGRLFGFGIVGMGLAYLSFAVVHSLYAAIPLMAVSGFFNSLFIIPGMTLVQSLTPSEMRGRVVAGRGTIIQTSLALGSAIGGVLLTVVSPTLMWLILGLTVCGSSLAIWLHPQVRGQR
ncbi:MAG TPA: MFS transporter [Chloroflexota bacterium]|nr:MFS transporter [Chloroflexota bacterium]